MTRLIKKYSILVIVSIVVRSFLRALVITLSPYLLMYQNPNGLMRSFRSFLLEDAIEYLINIVFVILLYREMKVLKVISIPILMLTFFSSPTGVIIFFIIYAYNNLAANQQIK
jgi:hypothetical protein